MTLPWLGAGVVPQTYVTSRDPMDLMDVDQALTGGAANASDGRMRAHHQPVESCMDQSDMLGVYELDMMIAQMDVREQGHPCHVSAADLANFQTFTAGHSAVTRANTRSNSRASHD